MKLVVCLHSPKTFREKNRIIFARKPPCFYPKIPISEQENRQRYCFQNIRFQIDKIHHHKLLGLLALLCSVCLGSRLGSLPQFLWGGPVGPPIKIGEESLADYPSQQSKAKQANQATYEKQVQNNQPANQPTNQQTKEPTNQPTNQLIKQPASQPTN